MDDPLRADVERYLHRVVGCLGERLAAPCRFVRSVVDVVANSAVVAPADDAALSSTVVSPLGAPAARTTIGLARAEDADDLPIAEYESLAASHVVARLQQLTPAELRRLQAFESTHRSRRTVLGKIEQLLGPA